MDQAESLRRLVEARGQAPLPRPARSLVLTGGKGGVGTSNVALNLAIALADRGASVVLVDADFGLANLDLLCDVSTGTDLGDSLASGRPLSDAITEGPSGVRLLVGAHGTRTSPELLADAPDRLVDELHELGSGADYLLIDAGSGLNPSIAMLSESVDATVVVTTPEPSAMADACASVRRLAGLAPIRLLVNQAHSRAEGQDCLDRLAASTRQFLGAATSPLGIVRFDPRVSRAVRSREPFVRANPRSIAARDVRRIASTLLSEIETGRSPGLVARMLARMGLRTTNHSRFAGVSSASPRPPEPAIGSGARTRGPDHADVSRGVSLASSTR